MKRETWLRLSLFIIFAALIPVVNGHTWATVIVSIVAVYSLVTGIIRLRRRKGDS